MRSLLGLIVLAGALGAVAGVVAPAAKAPPASVAIENPPIYPLSSVERGQRGKGWTVFASARGPEPFEFEVLGVMRSYLGPGEDLIIARLIGEQIERTGVISGMSGSPAYIDGKLVGAVGYRFGSFTKDAIAGITPIERMMASTDGTAAPTRRAPAAETPWGRATPIAVPIAVSGLNPAVAAAFQPELDKRGYGALVPTGSSSGGGGGAGARLYASGPIAGVLVDGDILLAGIGTVTWVHGDRFLAFGHPFLGTGVSQMPVSDAYIVTTVASEGGSWKMGQATQAAGMLTDDRLHAIGGLMGQKPDTVSVDVSLDLGGPRGKADALDKLRFEVFRHPTDTPLFAAIALANSLSSRVGAELGGTLEVKGLVKLTTGEALPFSAVSVADGGAVEITAAMALLGELGSLSFNGFREVELDSVTMSLKRRADIDALTISRVTPRGAARAGEMLTVEIEVQPYEKPTRVFTERIRVPAGLPKGKYKIVVADPVSAGRLERSAGLIPEVSDFASYLDAHMRRPEDGVYSIYLTGESKEWQIGGRLVPGLSGSMAGLLEGSGRERKRDTRAVRVLRKRASGAIFGEAKATLLLDEPSR
jgi:hypothetical protein